jgi:hypothetical protein
MHVHNLCSLFNDFETQISDGEQEGESDNK